MTYPRGAYGWRFSSSTFVHVMVYGRTLCRRRMDWGQRYSLRDVEVTCGKCKRALQAYTRAQWKDAEPTRRTNGT